MHLHAECLLAKARVARRNGEGYLPPLKMKRSENGKGEAQRRAAQARERGETLCALHDRGEPLAKLVYLIARLACLIWEGGKSRRWTT